MASLSIQEITWPFALIILAIIIGIVGLSWIYFKYRKPGSAKNPINTYILAGFMLIFIILLLDFLDILPPPGGSWLAEDYHWIVLIIIMAGVLLLSYAYIRKTKALPMKKRYEAAKQHVKEYAGVEVLKGNEGGHDFRTYIIKNIEAGNGKDNRPLTSNVTYFLFSLKEGEKCIVGIDSYKAELVDFVVQPNPNIIENLEKQKVALGFDLERSELEQGVKGFGEETSNNAQAHAQGAEEKGSAQS